MASNLDFLGRIWSRWGSYDNIPKAIFYLLKGDYRVLEVQGCGCGALSPKCGLGFLRFRTKLSSWTPGQSLPALPLKMPMVEV